jgi:molybdate transport repressor ModE-like protein
VIGTSSAQRVLLLASVARHGSMTQAAQAVGFSVSAISQQIHKLEVEAGQPLLQRHSRGIILTDAGEAVVRHAEQIHGQLTSLQDSLDDIAGVRAGTLRMGTFPTAGASLLPIAIGRFRQEHPGVELSVRSFRRGALLRMLVNREITMSLLWDYQWARLDQPDLDVTVLLDDPTDLVVSATHPLASRKTVAMSELLDENWVVRGDDHPMVEVLVRAADTVGFDPKVAYEANDYQEVQAMVAVGVGISIMPRLALTVLRNDVEVIPLSGDVPRRQILLARMKGSRPTGAEQAMTTMLLETAQSLKDAGVRLQQQD